MKKRKLLIIFFAILIVLIGSSGVFLLSNQRSSHKTTSDFSRFEWMQLLGDYFGFNEPTQTESLWSDIEKNNPYYKYIQAATEWDIIPQEDEFHGEDAVDGSFMAKTALKSMGVDLLELYAEKQGISSDNDYIDLLIREKLLKKEELQEDIGEKRAKEFLADITDFYQSTLRGMNAKNIVYKDGVSQIPEEAIISMDKQINKITLKKEYISDLKVGDIIVLNTVRGMRAKKIKGIEKENQLSLEQADLDKVIDSMVINENVSAGFEDIAKAYGAEIIDLNTTTKNNGVRAEKGLYQVQPLGVFDHEHEGEFDNKGFKIDFSLSYDGDKENMSITMTDHNTERFCQIQPPEEDDEEDVSSVSKEGYIMATIDVTKIYMSAFASFSGIIPQRVDVSSAVEASMSYTIGGKINFRKKIISCPLYGAGEELGFCLNIYLILGIDGALHIESDISNSQGVTYEKGKGVRKINPRTNDSVEGPTVQTSVEADITITPGIELQPVIMVLGENLFDVEIDISAEIKESIAKRPSGMKCEERSIAFPLFHIGVLEDDGVITYIAEKFDKTVSVGWDIITADNAPFKLQRHYENDKEVQKCTYEEGDEDENGNEEAASESNVQGSMSGLTKLKEFMDYKYSGQQFLVAPFEETKEGFKTQIKIYYYPSISYEEFGQLKKGDSFTVLGRKYTVGKSYETFIGGKGGSNKDPKTGKRYSDVYNPKGCCEIFDDEGHTYYISNIINPQATRYRVDDNDIDNHLEEAFGDYWFCDIDAVEPLYKSEIVDAIIMKDAKIYLTTYKDDNKDFDPEKAFLPIQCVYCHLTDRLGRELANYRGSGLGVNIKINNAGFITEIRPGEVG